MTDTDNLSDRKYQDLYEDYQILSEEYQVLSNVCRDIYVHRALNKELNV